MGLHSNPATLRVVVSPRDIMHVGAVEDREGHAVSLTRLDPLLAVDAIFSTRPWSLRVNSQFSGLDGGIHDGGF